MHCYNSTQNFKVEGSIYIKFVEEFLEPLVLANIDKVKSDIVDFDKSVSVSLGVKKKPLKPKSVQQIRRNIFQKSLCCKECDITFKSASFLKNHKSLEHTQSSINIVKHSTRNNSFSDALLCEDLTLSQEQQHESGIITERPEILENKEIQSLEYEHIKEPEACKITTPEDPREVKLTCYLCCFTTTSPTDLDNHASSVHEIVELECPKCEYTAVDKDVMRVHMKKHTGSIPYQCHLCEFEALMESKLEDHMESKHSRSPPTQYNHCGRCNKSFPYRFLLEHHTCVFVCEICSFSTELEKRLSAHIQLNHKQTKVLLPKVANIECEICDYRCHYNIQLKKHMSTMHVSNSKASQCDLLPQSEDKAETILSLLFDQNLEIRTEIETLKRQIKGSLTDFADVLEKYMENMKKEIKETGEKHIHEAAKEANKAKEVITAFKKDNQNTEHEPRKQRSGKPKVAWISTEFQEEVLSKERIESDLNVSVDFVKVDEFRDRSEETQEGQTHINISMGVSEVLEEKEADVLILQGGSKEITNIAVNEALMDSKRSIDDYKRSWFEMVEKDSSCIFKTAEKAVEAQPNLEVIILKRLPRYDKRSQDMLGIKSDLSEFANTAYNQLWRKSGSPQNIKIVDIDLQTQKYRNLRELIYGSVNSSKFDGVNLLGQGASRHFSYRLKQAVRPIIRKVEKNLGLSNPLPSKRSNGYGQPVGKRNFAEAVKRKSTYPVYSVPTSNRFSPLN